MEERGTSIVLIGMMGAGKSAVGRLLAKRARLTCFDTDELVAAEFGLTIPEIFAKYGEGRFRDAETDILRKLFLPYSLVVVTGGGIVLRQENVDLLKQLGTVVWLNGDEEILFQRASRGGERPLLESADPRGTFSELLRKRKPLYKRAADLCIDTLTMSESEVADAILNRTPHLAST